MLKHEEEGTKDYLLVTPAGLRHDNNLDFLRLMFAYAVVLTHIRQLSGGTSEFFLFHSSAWGIDGFFLISGYLVFRSWEKQPHFRAYALKRIFRIYPPYITVIILQCAVLVMAQGQDYRLADAARYVAANALFLNFLAPTIGDFFSALPYDAINGSLWTLKVEVAFYVLLPFTVIAARRNLPAFLVAAVIASYVYYAILLGQDQVRLANQLPGQIRLFGMGMLLAIYRHRVPDWIFVVLGLAAFAVFWLGLGRVEFIAIVARDIFLMCLIVVAAFVLPRVPVRHDISYTVFLVHFPLVQLALVAGFGDMLPAWGFMIGLVVATTFFGLALTLMIEQPLLTYGSVRARAYGPVPPTLLSQRTFGVRDG